MESVPNGNVKKKTTKKGKVPKSTRARKEKQKLRRETKRKCACSAKSCNVIGQELTLAFLHCLTFAYSLVAESEHACACVCEFARARLFVRVCVCVCVCACACVCARACCLSIFVSTLFPVLNLYYLLTWAITKTAQ